MKKKSSKLFPVFLIILFLALLIPVWTFNATYNQAYHPHSWVYVYLLFAPLQILLTVIFVLANRGNRGNRRTLYLSIVIVVLTATLSNGIIGCDKMQLARYHQYSNEYSELSQSISLDVQNAPDGARARYQLSDAQKTIPYQRTVVTYFKKGDNMIIAFPWADYMSITYVPNDESLIMLYNLNDVFPDHFSPGASGTRVPCVSIEQIKGKENWYVVGWSEAYPLMR